MTRVTVGQSEKCFSNLRRYVSDVYSAVGSRRNTYEWMLEFRSFFQFDLCFQNSIQRDIPWTRLPSRADLYGSSLRRTLQMRFSLTERSCRLVYKLVDWSLNGVKREIRVPPRVFHRCVAKAKMIAALFPTNPTRSVDGLTAVVCLLGKCTRMKLLGVMLGLRDRAYW